jgi:selenocysteine lyase/cysteine desulfurase
MTALAPTGMVPATPTSGIGRDEIVGIDEPSPVLGGPPVPYVNLDNAATTPPLRSVLDAVTDFLPRYSSVHRGTGHKSKLSTAAYERARNVVGFFVGADPRRDAVLFGRNTTDAINLLAASIDLRPDDVVLTTMLEHHSNDLPWRARVGHRLRHVRSAPDGTLDLDHLDQLLALHAGRVGLLTVTGASNVTGVVPPVHDLAERVHAVGGRILVDGAQLVGHRPVDLRPHDDPGHLDFVALSGHKMYAPFGTGALIGARAAFGEHPSQPGGGTVRAVTKDDVVWADLPDREEGGSPNVVGAVALAAAAVRLAAIGLHEVAEHERALRAYTVERMSRVPGLTIHGPAGGGVTADEVGVVPFTLDGCSSGYVASVLGHEHGIGVRSGCFCAQPYVTQLLSLRPADVLAAATTGGIDGMVRVSLGGYSDTADVDRVVEALEQVAAGDVRATYHRRPDGEWVVDGPVRWAPLAASRCQVVTSQSR